MTEKKKADPEAMVREIKRNTCRKFGSEVMIRNIPEGLRGEESITTICLGKGPIPICAQEKPCRLHQKMMGHRKQNKLEIETVTVEELPEWISNLPPRRS